MGNAAKLAIAVLVLLAVAFGVVGYLATKRPPPVPVVQQTVAPSATAAGYPVVVAAQTLSAGFPIPPAGLKVLNYPELPAGAFGTPAEVVGQIPQTEVGVGVPVLRSNLLAGLADQIPDGYRAIAIHVDQVIAVGDHLRPGDYVDVLMVLPGAGLGIGTAGTPSQARTVLPDLRVLAVGPQTVAKTLPVASTTSAFGPAAQTAPANQAPPTPPESVVLQVPTGEVAKLALASQSGKLLLAMRNPKDHNAPTPGAFPTPPPALAPSLLPVAAQKSALEAPENKAYAGLTLPGLEGSKAVHFAAPVRPKPLLEIYLGGRKETVQY